MKRSFFYLLLLLIFISCEKNNTSKTDEVFKDSMNIVELGGDSEGIEETSTDEDSVEHGICDTLELYFKKFEITPVVDLSYNDSNDTTTFFKAQNHSVYWKYNDTTTYVKIDGNTLNLTDEGYEGSYSIGGIRLFSIFNKEILAVQFYVNGCGGSCFSGNSLFYDFQNKATTYFSYTAMNCFSLYDFKNDKGIDLLSPEFEGEIDGPFYETYRLFKLNTDGKFKPETDKSGKPYFIKVFYSERSPEMQCEMFKVNWFEKLNSH